MSFKVPKNIEKFLNVLATGGFCRRKWLYGFRYAGSSAILTALPNIRVRVGLSV
jgi:hypothetical protein